MKNIHPKRLGPYACPKKECEKWLDSGKYLVLQLSCINFLVIFLLFFLLILIGYSVLRHMNDHDSNRAKARLECRKFSCIVENVSRTFTILL